MKKRMGKASDAGAKYAVIFGDEELAKGMVQVKELDTGVQRALLIETAIGLLQK